MCPTLQEEPIEQVNVAGFPGQPQRKYDPYSNTYNMGWRDHPNLIYGNPQETRANIQILDNQMGQMATAISRLEAQGSEKLPSQTVVNPRENASAIILKSGKEVEIPIKSAPTSLEQEKEKNVVANRNVPNEDGVTKHIPLLNAIKQVPHYAKFLKELCTIKRKQKLKGCEKVRVGENVYAIIQRGLPVKCKDPVNDLIFPADFYVLDMENGDQTTPIFFGRPFLKTSETKIYVHSGTLTMEFDGEMVKFDIYDAMKYPSDDNPIYSIYVIDSFAQEVFELDRKDELKVAIISNERPLPSVLQAHTPDLKPLHSHLKYVFLGDGGTLPVIIFNKLSAPQEEKHVHDEFHLQETFLDEQNLSASVTLPWYANIVNYLVTNMLPPGLSRFQRDKVKSDAKY
ncbi:uncharacterized protein [Aristolochia californica]|uniref:uncharacterized protein n=1 Tax=Aristolochia californica TaxID=171875 RepID=UPI0035D9CDB2